jgi:DNA polymerase (family 10)
MTPLNAKVAALLREFAAALRIQGADRFKIKAYQRAADTIAATDKDVGKLIKSGASLETLPGIGEAISAKILSIVQTGTLPQLERTKKDLPPELLELASKPLLDPARVKRIYKKLGIKTLKELQKSLESGAIGEALGKRIEYHVRQGLDARPRMLHWAARDFVRQFTEFLLQLPEVTQASEAGSHRRRQDTIGDLNFLVAGRSSQSIFKKVAAFPGVLSFEKVSRTQARFNLALGRSLTLLYAKPIDWGLALLKSTGSHTHVAELSAQLRKKRKSLTAGSLGKAAESEEAIYKAAGLKYIEPELREGRGEIKAALQNKLPDLIELSDIRGDLHMHTTASDGVNSILEMAEAAKSKGYKYIAIADHSQSLKITNGLTSKRLLAQCRAIDKVNAKLSGITILKSTEVDILEDGSLDYPDSILKELDVTVCSIHSKFALDKRRQTDRLLRAMDNPYTNIIGHATGRLLLRREGYELDFERLLKRARATGCIFEINANPNRLDLSDENARLAKEHGVKIVVNTDAHSIAELNFMPAGINQARRSWLEAKDVLNTLPLSKLLKMLKRKR